MISICDIKTTQGKLQVVDQRDWNVPKFNTVDIERLCKYSKANYDCDGYCKQCVITRLIEEYI